MSFDALSKFIPKDKPSRTFDQMEILRHWPSDKKVNQGRRILIDPQNDPVLAEFLVQNSPLIRRASPHLRISTATALVHNQIPYNNSFFESTIGINKDMFLGDFIKHGTTCSTKALIEHLLLANCDIKSRVHFFTVPGIGDHSIVTVDYANGSVVADPTWNSHDDFTPDLASFFHQVYAGAQIEASQVYAQPLRQVPNLNPILS